MNLGAVAAAIGRARGVAVEVRGESALAGGSIARAVELETNVGRFFVKTHEAALQGMFPSEAAGLRAIAATGTRIGVPEVVAVDEAFLVLELVEEGARGPKGDEDLGAGLAELHRATRDRFGFDVDTFCGATRQPNAWAPRWVDFYREQRLGHQVRLLQAKGRFGAAELGLFERLAARLDELLASGEPPALIHGDLWSGNALFDARGRPVLVDPSASFSHREAELGMMTLFGGFGARVFAAYEEAWPLAAGHRERRPLYELYHVLNHATLFGGGYVSQAVALMRRFA
jgi:protein-ribulosamine 3-kinase